MVDQQAKEVAFGGSHEAIKDVGIFPYVQVSQNAHVLPNGGKFVVGRKGNQHLVPDAVNVDDSMGGEGFDQGAFQKSDHPKKNAGSA